MRTNILILITLLSFACNQADKSSTNTKIDSLTITTKPKPSDTLTTKTESSYPKPTVLVLPPYDEIAGAGISPNIQKYIEQLVSRDTSLTLIPFSSKKLMHEPYSNVYDKKFCQQILKVVPCDFIILNSADIHI